MRHTLFAFIFLCVASWGGQNSYANAAVKPAQLKQAQLFLQAIKAQTGKFEQNIGGSTKAHGRYWLDFPHNFRFAYAPRNNKKNTKQQIITINKNWISVQERAGAEANRFPVAATPLAVLQAQAQAGFSVATIASYVTAFEVRGAQTAFTLRDPQAKIGGHLILYFDSLSQKLLGWRAVDLQNQKIDVRLFDVAYSETLPRRLFVVQEDEGGRN